ncbi:MAG: hypothetical protein H6Q90_3793 [Deltaproteobacteria bacterium]|nr:hypothetical protein [Deltaproteobacteria bacterium]
MNRFLSLVCLLALPVAAACGTTEAAPAQPSAPRAQPATTELHALCVEVLTHNRTCTDTYIPALVDLRAKYDVPAGIAAEVKADRDGMIAAAKQEWATDSADEAIAATCTKMASALDQPPPHDADAARACLTQTDCAAYTACIMPFFEKRFAK